MTAAARSAQLPVLVEIDAQIARAQQAVVLVEIDQIQIRSSQIVVLVEIGPDDPYVLAAHKTDATTPATTSRRKTTPARSAGAPKAAATAAPGATTTTDARTGVAVTAPAPAASAAPMASAGAASGGAAGGMAGFTIAFDDLNVLAPPGCAVTIKSYSSSDRGGPQQANLAVDGQGPALWLLLNWLGQRIRVVNPIGRTVWFGIVTDLTIGFGGFAVGASLTELANRIAVTYTEPDATGASTQTTTSWLDNTDSQGQFGVKELIFSAGEASSAQAAAKAAELLAGLAWPVGAATLTPAVGATVRCSGLYQLLDWKYFTNLVGRIENTEADGGSQIIGWQLTSAEIGFKTNTGIFHLGDQLGGPVAGDAVIVSGSARNNGTLAVTGKSEGNETYTATTISFDPADDILDSASGMTNLSANTFVKVTGSAGNAGIHWIKNKVSDGRMEISPGLSRILVAEAAGPSISLRTGASLTTTQALVDEGAGATVTLTLVGYILAQSFVAPISMTTGKIGLSLGRVGAPSDSFAVRICSDSSGSPGTVLGSATIMGSVLADETDIWLTLPAVALTASTTYWLKLERTGSVDAANFYTLGLSETVYATTKAWNGSAWIAFVQDDVSKSVIFRLLDTEDTSVSMARIVSQCGQAFVSSLSAAVTGITHNQYADNGATALAEINKLIDLGAAAGARLIASVDELNVLTVTTEPTLDTLAAPVLHQDGRLYESSGAPRDEGLLPVGEWVTLGGMPEDINNAWRISPIFVSAAAYDVARRKLNLTPRNARQLLQLFRNG